MNEDEPAATKKRSWTYVDCRDPQKVKVRMLVSANEEEVVFLSDLLHYEFRPIQASGVELLDRLDQNMLDVMKRYEEAFMPSLTVENVYEAVVADAFVSKLSAFCVDIRITRLTLSYAEDCLEEAIVEYDQQQGVQVEVSDEDESGAKTYVFTDVEKGFRITYSRHVGVATRL